MFLRNVGMYVVSSQNLKIFIVTTVTASNPTCLPILLVKINERQFHRNVFVSSVRILFGFLHIAMRISEVRDSSSWFYLWNDPIHRLSQSIPPPSLHYRWMSSGVRFWDRRKQDYEYLPSHRPGKCSFKSSQTISAKVTRHQGEWSLYRLDFLVTREVTAR
jgi:hypothetical protein